MNCFFNSQEKHFKAPRSGQYALEQTFLVAPEAMVTPETSPLAVLEEMAGARLI